MASVYIETSIPSYYHETRSTIQALAWRQATRQWWDRERTAHELRTSAIVLQELAEAPSAKSEIMLRMIQEVRILESTDDLADLVNYYVHHKLVPRDAQADAFHIALCSVHKMDILLTWNCRHLANANKAEHLRALNTRRRLHVPIIVTPYALMSQAS